MQTVSLFEAKTHLSRIVEAILSGKEEQVVISRRGKPAVRLTAIQGTDTSKRIGLAHGRFKIPDNIDGTNSVIASLFNGGHLR